MQHRFTRTLVASSILLGLAACGGGGGSTPEPVKPTPVTVCSNCSAGTLTGTAASGAAVAAAEVTVIDSTGAKVKGSTDANGVYKVDVSGLKAPFVIEILGNVGGEAVVLHSVATSEDVGKNAVNVTPLTEMISASVLGGNPTDKLAAVTADLTKITESSIGAAETSIKTRLEPVFAAAGLTAVNLRTTEFKPDHTGLDKALDSLKVTPSGTGYVVALLGASGSITVDPAKPDDTSKIEAPNAGALDDLAKNVASVQAMLNEFAGQFANAVPAASALESYFDAAFLHDGQNRTDFIANVLRQVDPDASGGFSYKGVRFDALRVENIVDADTLDVSYRVSYRDGFRPGMERLIVKRVGGKWVFKGDGLAARARVSLLSRLKEKHMDSATLTSLSGIHSYFGTWDGVIYKYYQRSVATSAGTVDLWLGREGDNVFGLHGWSGGEKGSADRLQRFSTTEYYGTPSGRVSNYIVFEVPTNRVAPNVTEIVVTGPGLPAAGLKMEPPIRRARPNWVFKGDLFDWNAFNADRCAQVNNAASPVAACGMDWTAVDKGSEYVFTLKDSRGETVATLADKLRTKPINEADAFAKRDALFPQLKVDEAHSFSVQNVFNDVSGPFLPGKPVTLNWTVPAQPGFRIIGVSLTVQAWIDDAVTGPLSVEKDYANYQPLFHLNPATAQPTTVTFSPAHPQLAKWAWSTLIGVDAFGNVWDHELSPDNPK